MTDTADHRLNGAQLRLLALLSVATFFEGWDAIALTQVLPALRKEMGLTPSHAGWLVGLTNIGTMAAFWLVRQADQRQMLNLWPS